MKDFFAGLYEIFISVFGYDLGEHLYGTNCAGDISAGLYSSIGLALVIITLILVLVFYYLFVDSKRNKWYHWLSFVMGNALIQFLIGFYLPYRDLEAGLICEDFTVTIDNTVFFGVVNAIWSVLFFIVFSFIFRWGSTDGKLTPFPK